MEEKQESYEAGVEVRPAMMHDQVRLTQSKRQEAELEMTEWRQNKWFSG